MPKAIVGAKINYRDVSEIDHPATIARTYTVQVYGEDPTLEPGTTVIQMDSAEVDIHIPNSHGFSYHLKRVPYASNPTFGHWNWI